MSTDIVTVLSLDEGLAQVQAAATMDRWNSGVLKTREAQVNYLRELDEGYAALDRGSVWIEGQKTVHGAYVYRNLWLLTDKGTKKIVDPIYPTDDKGQARKPEPLGTLVARHLGRRQGDGSVKPIASATATRYGKVARIVFDAGYSPDDSDWSRLTSVLVDDSDFCEGVLGRGDTTTRQEIESRLAILDTPAVESVETETVETETVETETGSQVPETEKTETETETSEARSTPVAAEPVGNAARFENILAEIAACTVSDDSDDVAGVFVIRDALTAYLRGFGDAVRAEGKAHYERLHKSQA